MTATNWTQTRKPTWDRDAALKMNDIAHTVFAPIYPVIARNALEATGIRTGVCLDLGSGPAMLAMHLARETSELQVIALDFSYESRQIAANNIAEAGLQDRVRTARGDVHSLPFADESVNLIVSRGSMFFWKNLSTAFSEMLRVLVPGGGIYVGGGFGSRELRDRVVAEMLRRDPTWNCYARKKTDGDSAAKFATMFQDLRCPEHRIIDDETGFWVVARKSG